MRTDGEFNGDGHPRTPFTPRRTGAIAASTTAASTTAAFADGTTRAAVLSTGESVAFGVHVAAETATRLLGGAHRPGAWTPAHLLGTDVATSAPGTRIEMGS